MYFLNRYIEANKLMGITAFYFIVSILLKIVFSINILIPCLWKVIFHMKCPGCGLTRAFIEILHLNIMDAYNANPLIFIILPSGAYYFYNNFVKFKKKLTCEYAQDMAKNLTK